MVTKQHIAVAFALSLLGGAVWAGPVRLANKAKMEQRALIESMDKVGKIKTLLSDETIDTLNLPADVRVHYKKVCRLLWFLVMEEVER